MKTTTPQTYSFTLVLAGVSEITDALENAIFEAGCDDATLASRDGVVFLDFDREARSFRQAIFSAIRDVHRAGCEVARIEPDDYVTAAEIARRVGRTRENIRQLVLGLRGAGDFPRPVAGLKTRSPLWRWTEVARWFSRRNLLDRPARNEENLNAATVAVVNDMLDAFRLAPSKGDIIELLNDVESARTQGAKTGRPTQAGRPGRPARAGEREESARRSGGGARSRDVAERGETVHR